MYYWARDKLAQDQRPVAYMHMIEAMFDQSQLTSSAESSYGTRYNNCWLTSAQAEECFMHAASILVRTHAGK